MATVTRTKFVSQLPDLNVILKPSVYRTNEFGKQIREPGVEAQFVNGVFETDDPAVAEAVREDPLFGHQAGGIFEIEPDPSELEPKVSRQMELISMFTVSHDVVALGEIIRGEKETHNRESVIEAAERAIRDIEDLLAQTGGGAEGKGESSASQTSSSG